MPKKSFHLRWNNHLQNLQSLFENIFDEQSLVDVTISCSDGVLYGHKLVLSACSPYFKQVFKDNPCKHPIVILKGVSMRDMRLLLEYMYKGSVDVGEEDLEMMLDTATDLQVKGLVQTSDSTNLSPHQHSKSDETHSFPENVRCTKLTPSSTNQHSDKFIWQAELVAKPSGSNQKDIEVFNSPFNNGHPKKSEQCSSTTLNNDAEDLQHKENVSEVENEFLKNNFELKSEKESEDNLYCDDEEYIGIDEFNESQETLQTNHVPGNESLESADLSWVCHLCSRRFQSKNSYQRHMMIHAGVKPHCCTFCNQSFLRLSHLQRHVRVHTGERPYACSQCPKQFARSDKLRQHCVIQHSHTAGSNLAKRRGRPRKHFPVFNPSTVLENPETNCNREYSLCCE